MVPRQGPGGDDQRQGPHLPRRGDGAGEGQPRREETNPLKPGRRSAVHLAAVADPDHQNPHEPVLEFTKHPVVPDAVAPQAAEGSGQDLACRTRLGGEPFAQKRGDSPCFNLAEFRELS